MALPGRRRKSSKSPSYMDSTLIFSEEYFMDWANAAIGQAEEELSTLTTHSPRRHALRSWNHLKQEPVFQQRVQRTREDEQQPGDKQEEPNDEEPYDEASPVGEPDENQDQVEAESGE